MAPFLSVVVPVWNRARRLRPLVDGLLDQRFGDFELLIVDDGSTDDTLAVARSYADPRVVVLHQENAGAPAARNHGLAIARGEYVLFVDSDDLVDRELLGTFARLLQGTGHAMASCGLQVLDEASGRILHTRYPESLGAAYHGVVARFMPGAFCVRRELLVAIGGYAPIPAGQQHELGLRLCAEIHRRGATVTAAREVRYTYVLHADATVRKNHDAVYRGDVYILEHHREALARSPERLAKYLDEAAVSAVRTGRHAEAVRLFRELARLRPTAPRSWLRLSIALSPALSRRVWAPSGASLGRRAARRLSGWLR